MDCNDHFARRLKGEVTLILCDRGRVLEIIRPNDVVDMAYNIVASWAAQDFTDVVAEIAVGDGGSVPGDPFTPIPPTDADTALVSEVDRKAIATITQLSANQVEYVTSFLPGEGTGQLTEAGLFTGFQNRMFARTTFGVIVKSGITLIVRWKITF